MRMWHFLTNHISVTFKSLFKSSITNISCLWNWLTFTMFIDLMEENIWETWRMSFNRGLCLDAEQLFSSTSIILMLIYKILMDCSSENLTLIYKGIKKEEEKGKEWLWTCSQRKMFINNCRDLEPTKTYAHKSCVLLMKFQWLCAPRKYAWKANLWHQNDAEKCGIKMAYTVAIWLLITVNHLSISSFIF